MKDNVNRRENDDKALVGVFEKQSEAINSIRRLIELGYTDEDITVVAKDDEQIDRIEEGTDISTDTDEYEEKVGTGAAIGGALGGITTALPALGLLAVPGIGTLLAAGPIAAILGGVVAGGVTGGLIGALVELDVDEADAKEYQRLVDEGKILVLVENREDVREEVYLTYRKNNSLVDRRNL